MSRQGEEGRRRKEIRIGRKGEEQTMVVDLSSPTSEHNDIISSESEAEGRVEVKIWVGVPTLFCVAYRLIK